MKTVEEILCPADQQDEFTAWMLRNDEAGGCFAGAKKLPDGTYAGVLQLAFTYAIALGVTRQEICQRRFCFEAASDCLDAFEKLRSFADDPVGFVASRPKQQEEDWLPIATAPKDGTTVRVAMFAHGHCHYCRSAMYRANYNEWVEVDSSRDGQIIQPTHYKPF